jgi:hypothetical protein
LVHARDGIGKKEEREYKRHNFTNACISFLLSSKTASPEAGDASAITAHQKAPPLLSPPVRAELKKAGRRLSTRGGRRKVNR